MSISEAYADRRFYRSADRALLGGVCAGVADYFGFNLRVLRLMAVIAFIFAMPFATIAYIAAVLLIPAKSSGNGSYRRRATKSHSRARSCNRRERRRRGKKPGDARTPARAKLLSRFGKNATRWTKGSWSWKRLLRRRVTSWIARFATCNRRFIQGTSV